MFNKILILCLSLLFFACGAKAPASYSSKHGEFRPINTLDKYTEQDKQKALHLQENIGKKIVYNPDTNAWE